MATFVNLKERAFYDWKNPPILPIQCESLFHMKTYKSASDLRAWTLEAIDRKEYIIELFNASAKPGHKLGTYVPVATIVSILCKLNGEKLLPEQIIETELSNKDSITTETQTKSSVYSVGLPVNDGTSAERTTKDLQILIRKQKLENDNLKDEIRNLNKKLQSLLGKEKPYLEPELVNRISIDSTCRKCCYSEEAFAEMENQIKSLKIDRDRCKNKLKSYQKQISTNGTVKCDKTSMASLGNDCKQSKDLEIEMLRRRLVEMDIVRVERDRLKLKVQEMSIKGEKLERDMKKRESLQIEQKECLENSEIMLGNLNEECDKLRCKAEQSRILEMELNEAYRRCRCFEEAISKQEEHLHQLASAQKNQDSKMKNIVTKYEKELAKKEDTNQKSEILIENLKNDLRSSSMQLNDQREDLKLKLRQANRRITQLTTQLTNCQGDCKHLKEQLQKTSEAKQIMPNRETFIEHLQATLQDIEGDNDQLKCLCERFGLLLENKVSLPTNAEVFRSKTMQMRYDKMRQLAEDQVKWLKTELVRCKEQGAKCLCTPIASTADSMKCNCSSGFRNVF